MVARTGAEGGVKFSENALKVLEARYLKKNEAGECVEQPAELFRRVAGSIAGVETAYGGTASDQAVWEERFFDLMVSGRFMPNSPTLMNAGREMGMLSACFVLPVRDSITDIFDSIKHTALIQKAGGGTGFAFDELRPTGDYIASSGGTTSGPISFWRAFSEATNAIQQGAFRRGANMGMMYIHHPDILKFLHAKQDLSQFTNYNISVKITDAWMDEFLADADSPHVVRNPRTGQAFLLPRELDIWKYDVRTLIPVESVEPVQGGATYHASPRLTATLPADLRARVYAKRDIWDIILRNAWQTGEPGVVFIDRINEHNPTPHVGRIEATNPCGEQPLLPYEACNLGSVNLGLFVRNACTPRAEVDWDALRETVHESTRFLDNVIDANNYPLPEIDAVCKANRKIGLGIMGFADALYRLNVAYNSDEGVQWGERFMKFVNDEAHNYSEKLAGERGCFPNWKGSIWDTRHQRPMRNACTTTVAPTGTISIIANCSGGIEPMFSLAFLRNVLRGQKQGEKPLIEVNETFREVARKRGLMSDDLLERLISEGTLAHIEGIPDDVKRVFVCAHDITPVWHMNMQAAFQRHCDSSISKTINFPNAATIADVEQIYRLAYDLRCKGVTVYRDGCRSFQPMALKEKRDAGSAGVPPASPGEKRASPASDPASATTGGGNGGGAPEDSQPGAAGRHRQPAASGPARPPITLDPLDVPELLSSFRMRQMTPFGNMHVHITVDPHTSRELEVFAQLGKGGDVANSDLEAICRMISLWLRAGGSLIHVIKQLSGIGSSLQIPTKTGRIMSLGDGLACALRKYLRAKEAFGLRRLLLGEADLALIDRPAGVGLLTASEGEHRPPATNRSDGEHRTATRGLGNAGILPAGDGERSRPGGEARTRVLPPSAPRVASTGRRQESAGNGGSAKAGACVPGGTPATEALTEAATIVLDLDDNGERPLAAAPAEDDARLPSAALLAHPDDSGAGMLLESGADAPELPGDSGLPRAHDVAAHYRLACPECGVSPLALQEGCRKCHACGWSAC